MKKSIIAIAGLLLILFVMLTSCSDSSSSGKSSIYFPLNLGDSWTYKVTLTELDYATGTVDTVSFYAHLSADSLVEAPNGVMTTRFNSWSDLDSDRVYSDYLAEVDGGLRMFGTEGTGFIIVFAAPKKPINSRDIIAPGDYGDLEWYIDLPDSNANMILPKPATEGMTWTYMPNMDYLQSVHEIIGYETIESAIGSQKCIHKHIVLDPDGVSYTYDYYYSSKGIVYAWFDFGPNDIVDDEGDLIGKYESRMKLELVEYTPGR